MDEISAPIISGIIYIFLLPSIQCSAFATILNLAQQSLMFHPTRSLPGSDRIHPLIKDRLRVSMWEVNKEFLL